MKYSIQMCLVFLVVLVSNLKQSKANFVFLYKNIHFYEIRTNFILQPFATFIGGDGICAARLSENHISLPSNAGDNSYQNKFDNEYHFEARTSIYSNYEKTLSFLIEIEFNSINLPGELKIEGYELKFFFDQSASTCVQIITEPGDQVNSFKKYKFTIKDPSFMDLSNPRYTFYFGKILVRALTTCDNKQSLKHNHRHLCAIDSAQSSPIELGIKSEMPNYYHRKEPDLCSGHLMKYTCILRYMPYSLNDHYYIILQAMSEEFETILGDSDIFSLDDEQIKKVDEARKLGKKSIYFENVEYFTHLDQENLYFAPNLLTRRSQMLTNGLVIKLIKSRDRLNYVGILDKPTEKNTCLNSSSDTNQYCSCFDKCAECYNLFKDDTKNGEIHYVPLNKDASSKTERSLHCKDSPFNLFNFDNVKMAIHFQNEELSSMRKNVKLDQSASMLSNRDFLPRLCIDFKYGEAKEFYKLNIIFNDYRRVAESSVVNKTYYKFNLYEYSYFDKDIHKKGYGKEYLFKLDVRPVAFIDPISSNDLVEIKHLKKGKYFLELQVKQRSKFCPGVDQCVDESVANNQIQCIKCNRLLIKFDLHSKMVSDPKSVEPSKQYSRDECYRLKPQIRVSKLDTTMDLSHFKCPKESTVLTNKLNNSNFDINEILFKTDTLAGLLPNNFNLSSIMLPYDQSEQTDLNEFCNGVGLLSLIESRYSIYMIVFILIITLISVLIYLISFHRAINYTSTSNINIVFYLSIFLNKQQQDKLNDFVLKYTNILKRHFKNVSIEIINYSTDVKTRSEAIENAHKIVYVCGTRDEVLNLQTPFIIGQNKFHDDYNKLHWFPQYEAKTINVTFNKQVDPLVRTTNEEANYEKNSLINSNSSSDSKRTSAEPSPKLSNFTNSSSVIKSLNYQEISSHKYLKLPEENNLFLSFLLDLGKNYLFTASQSRNRCAYKIRKMSWDIAIKEFDRKTRRLIKSDKSIVFHFEKNNKYNEETLPEYLNGDEFEMLVPMSSVVSFTQSASNDSSKTTYDATELTNEVDQMEQKPLIHQGNH